MQLDVKCQDFIIHGASRNSCSWPPQLEIKAIAREWPGDRGGIAPRSGSKRADTTEIGTFHELRNLYLVEIKQTPMKYPIINVKMLPPNRTKAMFDK